MERESEQQGMNWSWEYCYNSCTTIGTVPSLETSCPTFCISPCDQTIIMGNCLSRTSQTKRFIEKAGTPVGERFTDFTFLTKSAWCGSMQQKVRESSVGGWHVRDPAVSHCDSPHKHKHTWDERCRLDPAACSSALARPGRQPTRSRQASNNHTQMQELHRLAEFPRLKRSFTITLMSCLSFVASEFQAKLKETPLAVIWWLFCLTRAESKWHIEISE